VGQGGRGGLGGNLRWVAYLSRTSGLVEGLVQVPGPGCRSGCSGGRRSGVVSLGTICAFGGCVCASFRNWVRTSSRLGWSWWSWGSVWPDCRAFRRED
jgi:hypothetical protein